MKRLSFLIIGLLVLIAPYAGAQDFTVKGDVKDQTGEPLIGVNIKIKDTTLGVITDVNGKFSIKVPSGKNELILSHIGFIKKTVQVSPKSNELHIILKEDSKSLEEIVIVGYGTQKKSSLTSSIEVVKGSELLQMPSANLDEALSGQVAGLQVMSNTGDPSSGKEAMMRIRMTSGVNSAPLLVIDGVPRFSENASDMETRLSDLNPEDVESISILKDAAAAAVYGVRAANGVILVKTKRGLASSKIRVNYRGQYNLQKATKLPNFLDSYEFAKLYNVAAASDSKVDPFTDEQLEIIRNQSQPNEYANSNMLDYLDSHGYSTTHSLSLSGGGKNVRYYISGAYNKNVGLYSGVSHDRYNYSIKLDATLTKGLILSVDAVGSYSDNKNTSYATLNAAYNFSPLQPLIYTNGQLASISSKNPLIDVFGLGGYKKRKSAMNTLSANLKWEIPWVKGLSVYGKATYDDNYQTNKDFSRPVTLYIWDKELNDTKADDKTMYPKQKISLAQKDIFVNNWLVEAGVNYDRTFARKHEVSGTLVANYQQYNSNNMSAENKDLPGLYPEVIGSSNTGFITGTDSETQRSSLIGRAKYGYDRRYYIESSFRMDGSPKFHPDHRWAFFPTVSASWIISNEPFFRNWKQSVLSNAKIRMSTGILGRDGGVSDYNYLLNYMFSPGQGYNIGNIYRPGVIMATGDYPNEKLKWEKLHDYNLGLDLGFWDNRFGLTVEVYERFRTNMITSAPSYNFPPSTGNDGTTPKMNFGKVKAWGWDITLNHRNTIRDVKYNAALTFSYSRDKYLDYGDESNEVEHLRLKGHSTADKLYLESLGLFQTQKEIDEWPLDQDGKGNKTLAPGDIKYKDQNGDGKMDTNDLIWRRSSLYPDFNGSLRLGIRWKGIFANCMFTGVAGYKKYIIDNYSLENGTLQRFQDYHLTDSWSENNRNAQYPRIKFVSRYDNNKQESTFWLRNCNFIRLRSLNIGYSFQRNILKKMNLSTLSLSLQASNVFTWSSLKHMDPEVPVGYPIQKSFGASINIGF